MTKTTPSFFACVFLVAAHAHCCYNITAYQAGRITAEQHRDRIDRLATSDIETINADWR